MRTHSEAYYEAKVTLGLTSLLPLLALPLYALFDWVSPGQGPRTLRLLRAFEVAVPLMAALASAHLMGVEREAQFDQLRRSYPEEAWHLPLLRTGEALLLAVGILLFGAAAFSLTSGAFSVRDVLLPVIAPTLYLMGVALLVGNLTGSYWAAAGTAMGYWLFDLLTQGEQTRLLYLFDRSLPLKGVSYGLNRWLLAGLGVGLILMNGWIHARRRG